MEMLQPNGSWKNVNREGKKIIESEHLQAGLVQCTYYSFRARAINNLCPGGYSEPLKVKTGCPCPGKMKEPTTSDGKDFITLKWETPDKLGETALDAF